MRKTFTRFVAAVLALMLSVNMLAACGDSGPTEIANPVTATSVAYNASGIYTTLIASEQVDLSGIDPAQTEVTCVPSTHVTAEITEIVPSGKGWSITFSDKSARKSAPTGYTITFKNIDQTADVGVIFPEMSLTSNKNSVTAAAKNVSLTLTLDGGSFEETVYAEQVTLGGSFAKMKIKSLSVADNKMKLSLTGSPVKNKQINAYQSGTVTVQSSGIVNGYKDLTAEIEVEKKYIGISSSSIRYTDGTVSVDLIAYGDVNVKKLTKDNVTLDGFTTESVEPKDAHTAVLTLSSEQVKNANGFVKAANGKSLNVNGAKATVRLSQASLNAAFDFCAEDGDNLELTMVLDVSDGSFANKISKSMFTFDGDYKDAEVKKVKRVGDTEAELVIAIPANGQTADSFRLNGTVTAAAKTLVNEWGEAASAKTASVSAMPGEEMSRASDVSLNKSTLLEIQKYVRGLDTTRGAIFYWAGLAGQGISIGKTVLELAGVIESEHMQEMKLLHSIDKKLDAVQATLNQHTVQLEAIETQLSKEDFKDYNKVLRNLDAAVEGMRDLYINAKAEYAPTVALVGEELPQSMVEKKQKPKKLLDWEKATDKERIAYNDKLTDIMINGSKNPNNPLYKNYSLYSGQLTTYFKEVTGYLMAMSNDYKDFGDKNPIDAFDEYAAKRYNFDTQAYLPRLAYRNVSMAKLEEAMAMLYLENKGDTYATNADFLTLKKRFLKAMQSIEDRPVTGIAPDEVDCYRRYEDVQVPVGEYIGEVMLSGEEKNGSAAKQKLKDLGYKIFELDLNENAGGYYVYLGYKTTKDYSKAIKDITLRTGKGNHSETYEYNGHNYTLCPRTGAQHFIDQGGDLNESAGGDYIFLYYTTEDTEENTAVYEMYLNGKKSGSVCEKDLNTKAGGDDIFLHLKKCEKDANVTRNMLRGSNNKYYPYSYVLGKKVYLVCSKDYDYHKQSHDNFDDVKNKLFVQKLSRSTIADELKSAGILRDEYTALKGLPFLTCVNTEYKKTTYWEDDPHRSGRKDQKSYKVGAWTTTGVGFSADSIELKQDMKISYILDPSCNPKNSKDRRTSEFIALKVA